MRFPAATPQRPRPSGTSCSAPGSCQSQNWGQGGCHARDVARTQAVFYRDERGAEPVDDFIEALLPKHAAKIDDYIAEHLNGRRADEPPPDYPISSQLDGELRELRMQRRATRGEAYREARDEYAAIRALRERNWIAAHIRERRYELDLTQQEVAERAGTSHSFISKLEGGDHIPTIPVLQRILAVLDEELLIGIQPRGAGMEAEREVAPVPEPATA
jgi:DNA-binding XRE family transcriptional regulator